MPDAKFGVMAPPVKMEILEVKKNTASLSTYIFHW